MPLASSINCARPQATRGNELLPEDRDRIVKLYAAFEENEYCKIFKNEEFMYREYTIMQPLQRSYAITEERIQQMLADGTLNSVMTRPRSMNWKNRAHRFPSKTKLSWTSCMSRNPVYEGIISALQNAVSDKVYLSPEAFMPVLRKALVAVADDKKLLDKIADGLSVMDKNAEIQRGQAWYNTLMIRIPKIPSVCLTRNPSMITWFREVLPHVPDAKAFWEEKTDAKKPVIIKTGAEIPAHAVFLQV